MKNFKLNAAETNLIQTALMEMLEKNQKYSEDVSKIEADRHYSNIKARECLALLNEIGTQAASRFNTGDAQ